MDDTSLSKAARVWNRACSTGDDSSLHAGDRALRNLLLVHGYVMNGGVFHALDCLSREELAAGVAGYRFFGFDELAALIQSSPSAGDEELDDELDEADNR